MFALETLLLSRELRRLEEAFRGDRSDLLKKVSKCEDWKQNEVRLSLD